MTVITRTPTEEEIQRAKSVAWDFLMAYNDPDPVPGATLLDYLDAAYAYACDATRVDLARVPAPAEHKHAESSALIRRFFHMLPKERDFYVTAIDLSRRDAERQRKEVLKQLRDIYADRAVAKLCVLILCDKAVQS